MIESARPLLTREQAAHLLGISVRTLNRLHAKGMGPPRTKFGGSVRYSVAAINRWLRAQETDPVRLRLPS
jgi:excisionase family DNA binding protein